MRVMTFLVGLTLSLAHLQRLAVSTSPTAAKPRTAALRFAQ